MKNDLCRNCFIRSATQGIWLLDESGWTTFANDSIAEILGMSTEEIQNHQLLEFIDGESQNKVAANIELSRQGMKLQQEVKLCRRDGTEIWAILSTNPILNQNGKYTGTLAIVTDISYRKSAEEQLRQEVKNLSEANRTKDSFLAIVAHELRTPLTAIQGWADVLLSGKLDENSTIRAIKTIRQNAQLQNQLIDDLLDLSRMMRGKLTLNITPINPIALISSAIETLRPTAQAKNIEIESLIDLSVGKVLADTERLQQVFWNLISNAVKFTPKEGKIEISLEVVGSEIQIQVKDTGVGINANFLPFVFEAFRQGDTSLNEINSGLGLGLAIVRQLVELHKGSVYATSPGEGKGSTFTVRLPLATATNQPISQIDFYPLIFTEEKQIIDRKPTHHCPDRNRNKAVTGIELLTSYAAYYLSRGKAVISPIVGPITFTGQVYRYSGYHTDFQSFWQKIQQRRDFLQLYMEGDICCFGDFLDGRYTVSECARCNLPIPTVEGHAYSTPICTVCDDNVMECPGKSTLKSNVLEDEFINTRVLAIGKLPQPLKNDNKLFSANGFQVNFVENLAEITPELLYSGVDMVLIDAEISESQSKSWERKLRSFSQLSDVPIIALTPEAGQGLPWMERNLGVEDYLLPPLGGDRLANHLRQMYQPTHSSCNSSWYWFPR